MSLPASTNPPLDTFRFATYDPYYHQQGDDPRFLSTWVQLHYANGTVINFNVYDIQEVGQDVSPGHVSDALHDPKLGAGGVLMPGVVDSATAPRLWQARQNAILHMETLNLQATVESSAAVFVVLGMGAGGAYPVAASGAVVRGPRPAKAPAALATADGAAVASKGASDIALGLQDEGLKAFARQMGAASFDEWPALGLYDSGLPGWGPAFHQAMTRTIAGGGKVRFNLQGVNVTEALAGDPAMWVGRYTSWELQQVLANPSYRAATTFYNTAHLTAAERALLGL